MFRACYYSAVQRILRGIASNVTLDPAALIVPTPEPPAAQLTKRHVRIATRSLRTSPGTLTALVGPHIANPPPPTTF